MSEHTTGTQSGGTGREEGEPRLRPHRPEDLDEAQRSLYEAIAGGPRAGGPFRVTDDEGHLLGPFDALLLAPGLGDAVQRLGAALRFSGTLPARTRELVICAVAAAWRSRYEWYAHSRVGRAVGVSDQELDEVLRGAVPATATPAERTALLLAQALLESRRVDADLYAAAVEDHGRGGVLEIAVVVGYYQTLAGVLEVFALGSPESTPFDAKAEAEDETGGVAGVADRRRTG